MKLLTKLANRFGLLTRAQFAARMRAASASFQAAGINRLTTSWAQHSYSADAQNRVDLKIVRDRARELRNNNDYGAKFVGMLKANVLGDQGFNFRNKAKDPDRVVAGKVVPGAQDEFANKLVEEKFYRWGRKEHCTVTGKLNWCDVQNIVLESVAVDGEILVRKVIRPDNPFGFTLQLIESDYLDDDYDQTLEGGRSIRMGVESDEWGRTIAYHLRTWNPNDTFVPQTRMGQRYRLPASEVIHLGINRRPNSSRYMSWMATSAYRLNMLGKYEEAETTAARAAASKMAFLTKTNANQQYDGAEDEEGNRSMDAEPGAIEELPYGMDIKVLDWNHPNSSYAAFMKTALRGVSAGLCVSYNTLANDMESVNFASGKLGLDAERDVFKKIQYWMIESFCEDVFTSWLESSFMAGALAPLPVSKFDKFNAPYFNGRRWDDVNPQQEIAADVARLNARLTSHSRILAARNIDRDELFDEIAADIAAAESRGFDLDAATDAMLQEAEAQAANQPPPPEAPAERNLSFNVDARSTPAPAPVAPAPPPAPAPPAVLHQTITLDSKNAKQVVKVIRDQRGAPTAYEVTKE